MHALESEFKFNHMIWGHGLGCELALDIPFNSNYPKLNEGRWTRLLLAI